MNRLLTLTLLLLPALAGGEPSLVGNYPLSGTLGASGANYLAVNKKTGNLWIVGGLSQNLLIVDGVGKKPLYSLPEFRYVRGLAVDSVHDRAYVADYSHGYKLTVLDTKTRDVLYRYGEKNTYFENVEVDEQADKVYVIRQKYDSLAKKYRPQLVRWNPATHVTEAVFAFDDLNNRYPRTKIKIGSKKIYLYQIRMIPTGTKVSGKHTYTTYQYKSELLVLNKANLALEQTLPLPAYNWEVPLDLDETAGILYAVSGSRVYRFPINASGNLGTPTNFYCACYGSMGLVPGENLLYTSNYSGVRAFNPTTGQLQFTKEFKGSSRKQVAVDRGRSAAYAIDYYRSEVLVSDASKNNDFGFIDIRRDSPSDISLSDNSSNALIATDQSAGLLVWDTQTHAEKQFVRTWSFTKGVAQYPKFGKAFVFQGGYGFNSSFSAYMAVDLQSYKWTYMPQYVHGLFGKSEEVANDKLLLVKQYGAIVQGHWKSQLIFFDPMSGVETDFLTISAATDSPRGVAKNPANNKAYIALYGNDTLAVVDLAAKTLLKKIPVGKYPEGVATDPIWNRVFVSNYGSNSVSVIDSKTDEVIATIPVGKSPRTVAVKKKGTRIYVANEGDATVSIIHGGTLEVVATVSVEGTPRDIAVDEKAERIYVANYSSSSISVIEDIASNDTKAPVVSHSPFTGAISDFDDLILEAQVDDDDEVAVVTLTFWSPESENYTTIPMEKTSGSTYRAVIPSTELMKIKGKKVSYFIDATDYEGNGPPTGSIPGTADAPNTFTVNRTLEVAWSKPFDKVYGGFYRMIPGPSASVGELRSELPGLEIATGNEEYYPLGHSGPPGRWFLFRSNGTVVLTKNTENDEAHSSTTLYDLDGDGTPEILGGTTSGNQIQAFDSHGNWTWRYKLGSHAISTPAVDELKKGEGPTVFGGSFDKYVRSIDGVTGKLNWAFPVSNFIWSSPAVKDLDGDGVKEVLITSESGSVYLNGVWTYSKGYLYCLNAETGALRWKYELPAYRKARTSPALADLDGDGIVEVLIGDGRGTFRALSGDTGSVKWSFATGGDIYSSAAVGDIDGDGNFEIVFGSNDGHLYALKKDGSLFWKSRLGSEVYGSPALARRNPGESLSVYATTWGGLLYVLNGTDGKIVGGASVEAEIVSSPVVADADGDGKLDIFFQDRKGNIGNKMKGDMFWAFRDNGSSVTPYAREWPMFRRDPAHTGVYPMEAVKDETPPAYSDFRSLDDAGKSVAESEYNPLALGVTVQLTVQDLESGLSQNGFSVNYSTNAGSSWITVAAALSGNTLSGYGLDFAWTVDTAVCEGKSPCTATNQVKFIVEDVAGNSRNAGPFAVRIEKPEAPDVAPAIPSGLAVEAPHMGGSLKLTWNSNGEADLARYRLYRDGAFLIATTSTSYSDEGLTDGTTYTYRLSAVSTAELESEQSAPISGVPADKLPPDSFIIAPADESVLHESIATISGSASDAGISGVEKIDIWLKDISDGEEEWLVANGTTSFQLALTDLEDTHVYQAASRATDAEGNVEAQLTIMTFSIDLPPSKTNTPTASANPLGARIDLAWVANTETDVVGYKVYRDGNFLIQTSTDSLSDTGLNDGTTYSYRIAALDKAGQEGPKSDAVSAVPLDGLLPSSKIMTPKSGAVMSSSTVHLSGTALDTGGSGLAKVDVSLKDLSDSKTQWFTAKGLDSFTRSLENLKDGHSYEIASRATDGAGNVETNLTAVSFSIDLPPAKANTPAASAHEAGARIDLSWTANSESDLAGYKVYRDGEFLTETMKTSLSDTGLTDGQTYTYRIAAYDNAGNIGEKSDEASAVPLDGLLPSSKIIVPTSHSVYSKTTVSVSGTAKDSGSGGLARVRVFLKTESGAPVEYAAEGKENFSLSLTGLSDLTTYYIVSQAEDTAGNKESTTTWTSFSIDLFPGAVANLKAKVLDSKIDAKLTWTGLSDSDLAGYRVYKDAANFVFVTKAEFTAEDLERGTEYVYYVSAVDKRGQEGPKTSVSFETPNVGKASAVLKNPKDGKTIWGNAVQLLANASDNTAKVVFQFFYQEHTAWTAIETDETKPYHIYWNVSDANVSTGSYRLRAVAYDENGLAAEAPEEITVTIDDANADIVEDGNPNVDPNKDHKLTATVAADKDDEVDTADGTKVKIPKDTVDAGDKIEIVSVSKNNAPEPKKKKEDTKHLKSASVFKEISFVSGKDKFEKAITVTLPTPDEDKDGILDGTEIEIKNLKPYFYDEAKAEWVKIKTSGNYALSSVTGQTGVAFTIDHFTLFGLFEEYTILNITEMAEVYCFPNPARAGQSPTFHVEAGAADKIDLRIYDLSGELVHSAEVLGPPSIIDDGQGPEQAFEYQWNTGSVGSGVYYYVVAAHGAGIGSSKKTGKCSVIK